MVKTSLQPYSSDLIDSYSTIPLGRKVFAIFFFSDAARWSPSVAPNNLHEKAGKYIYLFLPSPAAFQIPVFQGTIQPEPSFPHFPMPIHHFLSNNFRLTVSQTCSQLKTSSHPDVQISHGEVLMGSEERDNDERFLVLWVSGHFRHEKVGLQLIHWENLLTSKPCHHLFALPAAERTDVEQLTGASFLSPSGSSEVPWGNRNSSFFFFLLFLHQFDYNTRKSVTSITCTPIAAFLCSLLLSGKYQYKSLVQVSKTNYFISFTGIITLKMQLTPLQNATI